MGHIGDYNEIMGNRELFNKTVYTPLSEALKILEERRNNPELVDKVTKLLNGNIPEALKNGKCGVQFRQIATPNEDCRAFSSLTKENNLGTLFFEYHDDKFTSNNSFKHSLGQLRIQGLINKNGEPRMEKVTIVDFSKNDGKKLKDVTTLWGEPLINFHKKLFDIYSKDSEQTYFFEASEWLKMNGEKAEKYYINFFTLFSCYGILFENFLMDGTEGEFSKKIVLPAIDRVFELTGVRPLIVPIPPMDMENDDHWISFDNKITQLLKLNLNSHV